MSNSNLLKTFLSSCLMALLLVGCGDSPPPIRSGNPNPPNGVAGITVTGNATAPGGAVAIFENNRPVMTVAMNVFFTPVYADVTGLQPVGGATVELIRIDDDGNQVGAVLASTVTSATGDYSLQLPSGVPLAANLIVRITGTGVSMAAMVVEQVVNINPISQYVLSKFVDDTTLTLATLPLNQVIALQGRAREFDISATADFASMLARLETDLGDLVDTEIAGIKSTPDDGTVATSIAGTWHNLELGFALHDSDIVNTGNFNNSFNMSLFGATISLAADPVDTSVINVTDVSTLIDAWANLNFSNEGSTNINSQIDFNVVGEDDSFPVTVNANGNITAIDPFEEQLQTVSIGDGSDPEGDGPDHGRRRPATTQLVDTTGNNNAFISVNRAAAVRYLTIDTNNDGIKDAINANAKVGDEVQAQMFLLLKGGSGMSNASLNGGYGFVGLTSKLSNSNSGYEVKGTVILADMDGDGNAEVASGGISQVGFVRSPGSGTAAFIDDTDASDGNFSLPYSLSASGEMMLETDIDRVLEGWVNNDATLLGLVGASDDVVGDLVTQVEHQFLMGVPLPTELLFLEGAVYRMYPLAVGAGTSGYTEIFTFGRSNTLSFAATTATFTGQTRGYDRESDLGQVNAFSEANALTFTVDGPGVNGVINLSTTETGGVTNLRGFVSEDGKVILLRLHGVNLDDGERLVGIMLGVRQ